MSLPGGTGEGGQVGSGAGFAVSLLIMPQLFKGWIALSPG